MISAAHEMETVNNIVTTASAAIWGENGAPHDDEPMSGVQGKGSADDPYDAGNRDGKSSPMFNAPSQNK